MSNCYRSIGGGAGLVRTKLSTRCRLSIVVNLNVAVDSAGTTCPVLLRARAGFIALPDLILCGVQLEPEATRECRDRDSVSLSPSAAK